jgi:hypothetical protein
MRRDSTSAAKAAAVLGSAPEPASVGPPRVCPGPVVVTRGLYCVRLPEGIDS